MTQARRDEILRTAQQLGVKVGWDGDTALLTPSAAAIWAGVSRRTIYLWVHAGKLATRLSPNGKTRIVINGLWDCQEPNPPKTGVVASHAQAAPAKEAR